MAFIFQQPGTANLIDEINSAAVDASGGGGIFAFASRGGVEALFACDNFTNMLTQHRPFHLIVGIDAITNAEALLCLAEKITLFPDALTVEVFYHEQPNSTFHPKFSWFCHDGGLRLLAGSGNLTLRGLGQITEDTPPSGNWEAFSVQALVGAEATITFGRINTWLAAQRAEGTLIPLDDERARDKAMANGRVRFARAQRRPTPEEPAQETTAAPLDGISFDTPEVLVRELPRNRPGQADVGQANLKEFFGYEEEGVAQSILLQHVSSSNELGPTLEIQLFVNQSRNYRLEVHAMAELEYDVAGDDSRMILIATKLDRRSFRYAVLPVTAPEYAQIIRLLGPVPPVHGRSRAMRDLRLSPEELLAAWPEAPSNLLPFDLLMPEP